MLRSGVRVKKICGNPKYVCKEKAWSLQIFRSSLVPQILDFAVETSIIKYLIIYIIDIYYKLFIKIEALLLMSQ